MPVIISGSAGITTPTIDLGTPLPISEGGTGSGTLTGEVVSTTSSQTITNKDLSSATNTFPASIATLAGSQTLTNKTLTAPTVSSGIFSDGYTEDVSTGNSSTSYTIDLANGTIHIITLTGNCTFTFPTATAGRSFMLLLKQDATGSRTVTWPTSVKWPNSTAPTITATANKGDKYVFTADGTNWWGSNAGQNYL